MTPNNKQYKSIPSHNVESQALIADETIEQGFSSHRRPFMAIFIGVALATIAAGSFMVHQTLSGYRVEMNNFYEHITVIRKDLKEVMSNLENTNSNVALIKDEFESRDLAGTLAVGEQCYSSSSCASGACVAKPYAFCSAAPTTSPTLTPGTVGSPCNYNLPRGPDCNDGLYCPMASMNYSTNKYESFCQYLTSDGSYCYRSWECASHYCSYNKCAKAPPTQAPVPNTPANKGRCGPLFNGRMCDCTHDEFYCNSDNGYCGYTTAHRDAQKGEHKYDCEWTH